MKKSLSLLVALVMMLTMFATTAFAAEEKKAVPTITTSATELKRGDQFTVTVYAPDVRVASMTLTLYFDGSKLSVPQVWDEENEEYVDDYTTLGGWGISQPSLNADSFVFGAATSEGTKNLKSTQKLAEINFIVKEDAAFGELEFTATYVAYDEEEKSVIPEGAVIAPVSVEIINVVNISTLSPEDFTLKTPLTYTGSALTPEFESTKVSGFKVIEIDGVAGNTVVNAGSHTATLQGIAPNSGVLENVPFEVAKAEQSISVTDPITVEYGKTVEALSGIKENAAVTYTVTNESETGVVKIENGVPVVRAGSGTATVTATIAETDNYKGTVVTFTVNAVATTVEVPTKPETTAKGEDVVITAGNVFELFGFSSAAEAQAAGLSFEITYLDKDRNPIDGVPDKAGFYYCVITVYNEGNKCTIPNGTTVELPITIKADRPPQSGKPGSVSNFVDVDARAYYYDAVEWAVANGITEGKTYFKFAPNEACTRAQMVTFLWRAAGCPTPSGSYSKFVDVNMNKYYADAVLWAVEEGITTGKTATTFAPNEACTRAQMATFLYRFAGGSAIGSTSGFVDVDSSKYYAPAVAWAVKNGVTNGTTANTFSPNNVCTRAQMVTFLYRYFEG